MKIKRVTLKKPTLNAYFNLIETITEGKTHFFRGQSSAKWSLTPKLYRNPPFIKKEPEEDNDSRYTRCEEEMVERFFAEGMPYLQNAKRGFIADRIIAQHYGVPTRLLDWSRDPLVALFFAVQNAWVEDRKNRKGSTKTDKQTATDAAVFCINQMRTLRSKLYFDINDTKRNQIFKDLDSVKIGGILPPIVDQRIFMQKSVFTLQKWEATEEGKYKSIDQRGDITSTLNRDLTLKKIIIPAKIKTEILRKLFNYGVNRQFLFPGLQSVGENIACWAEVKAICK